MARESKKARYEKRFGKPERFADAVQQMSWKMPSWTGKSDEATCHAIREATKETQAAISKAVVIDARNVSDFFYSVSSQEEWDFQNDFHCYALPFNNVFIEMRRPPFINSEGSIQTSEGLPVRWGWLFANQSVDDYVDQINRDPNYFKEALEASINWLTPKVDVDTVKQAVLTVSQKGLQALDELGLSSLEKTLASNLSAYGAMMQRGFDQPMPIPTDGMKWRVEGRFIMELGGYAFTPGGCTFRVSEHGKIMEASPTFKVVGGQDASSEMMDHVVGLLTRMSQPAFMALSFMGCKNVGVEVHEPDAKLNRERTRHGLKPFLRYHTINIEPMRKVLRTEGKIETNGLKKALHICRGHFARYTEDKPLFGHTTGLVWRPAHARGSAKEGIVVSDYKVNSPS